MLELIFHTSLKSKLVKMRVPLKLITFLETHACLDFHFQKMGREIVWQIMYKNRQLMDLLGFELQTYST